MAVANKPPVCSLRISCSFTLKGHNNAFVLSLDNSTACVTLDGSHSSDSNHDPLQFGWLVDAANPQRGAVITNCLALGCHSVQLSVSDGRGGVANCETRLCVITAGEAIAELYALVLGADLGDKGQGHGSVNKNPLLASLKAAAAAFEDGDFVPGMNDLQAFQQKVRAQLGGTQANAKLFIGIAQTILDAVGCSARITLGSGGHGDK